MRLDRLRLCRFRNYGEADLTLDGAINVVSGKNAQGKTNLLEAVCMLATGRSFRTRFDREIIGFGSDFATVEAEIFSGGRQQALEIRLRRGAQKQIRRNGARVGAGELCGGLSAVLFCPSDLDLIREGAAARRRLLDMAISQLRPGYARLLADYRKLCENKTRLLRDYREDPAMLGALDVFSDGMARAGAKLIRYRASFVRRLGEEAAPIHLEFSGAAERLELRYATVSAVTDPTAAETRIYEQLREHQRRHLEAEKASGVCLSGPHRDDIEISIDGLAARAYASQGQARTAALSLKLAEREIFLKDAGEYPLLLLDDVLSELDPGRQEFVLNRIGGGQTLITCCEDEQIVKRTGGRVIFVENGTLRY